MSLGSERPGAIAIAVAGGVALAVAMGIGRFAFTPILPMMLHDGAVDLHAASWLASANYLGYLSGALLCTFVPLLWMRLPGVGPIDGPALVRAGLAATGVLTLTMALPLPVAWPALRFLAGVASAMVFVFGSGWCLTQLALRGRAELGGAMFVGPGAGIVASGLLASALVAWGRTSALAWLVFGVLACLLSASIWRTFRTRPAESAAAPVVGASRVNDREVRAPRDPSLLTTPHPHSEVATLAFAYGISGFGYIVTATFLPVIARAALPADSPWLDLFWPIFGAGVILGAVLATRVRVSGDLRIVLAGGYLVQSAAIAVGLALPTAAGFALGSFLLGLPFTALTYFALQEVRRLRPHHVAATTGLVTALWSIGQSAGPPMVAVLLRRTSAVGAAFTLSLAIAAGALVVGAIVFVVSSRVWPRRIAG